jgi:hypothetical protein
MLPRKPATLEQLIEVLRKSGFEVEDVATFLNGNAVKKPPAPAPHPSLEADERPKKMKKR